MISFNMIGESLGYEVVNMPDNMGARFSQLLMIHAEAAGEGVLSPILASMDASAVLLFGTQEAVEPVLRHSKSAFALCVSTPGGGITLDKELCRRAMVLETCDSVFVVHERAQAIFITVDSWVGTMKEALLDGGGYQKLLNCSEQIFGNFISVLNSEFTLLAWTKNNPIDDKLSMEFIKNGKHTPHTIELFRRLHVLRDWEEQEGITFKPTSEITTYPTLDYVFKVSGNYFVCVTMHCNAQAPSPGLIDTYQLLVDHMFHLVQADWDRHLPLSQTTTKFFYDLLTHQPLSHQELSERLTEMGASLTGPFRLVAISFPSGSGESSLADFRIRHLKDFFPYCIIGSYEQYTLLLDPHGLELEVLQANLRPIIATHSCSVGISNGFSAIEDLPYSFQQSLHALEIGRAPEQSLSIKLGDQPQEPMYLFSSYFTDYVIQSAVANDDLIAYSAGNGVISKIARYDQQHGTNDLTILYQYLRYERNAGAASKKLFMHRNTLLYRVHKMEERFKVNLDDPNVREMLNFEFHIHS